MNHGKAVAKKDINDDVKKGDAGIITAYLPEDKRFAVHFGGINWITYRDINEEEFKDIFDVDLNE